MNCEFLNFKIMVKIFYKKKNKNINTYLLIIILITAFTISSKSQNLTGNISGSDNKILGFATIRIFKINDTIPITTTIADSNGVFKLKMLKKGYYKLAISYINYDTYECVVNLQNVINLKIKLIPKINQLQSINIKNQKRTIEIKADKIIYNLDDDATIIGANLIDILHKTPLVDIKNNIIGLIGKSEIKVMINGRLINLGGEQLFSYLKALPPNKVKKIEIITTPPSKYDASGNSGLINIIFIQNKKEGFNGNLENIYEQTYYATNEISGYLSGSTQKMGYYIGANYRNGKTRPVENMNIINGLEKWEQTNTRNQIENRKNILLGIDYSLNKSNSISVNYTGLLSKPNENAVGKTNIYNTIYKNIDSFFITKNSIIESLYNHDFNINYVSKIDTNGKVLTINSDYFIYNNKKDQVLNSEIFVNDGNPNQRISNQSYAPQKIDIYTISINYEVPFKNFKLDLGGKYSNIKIDNDYKYFNGLNQNYISDTNKSNHFEYSEITQAIYSSVSFNIKKITFQFGIRGENTSTEGVSLTYKTTNINNYLKIFPTLFIQYTNNDKNIFNISYGKRINRPGYWELNPFRYYINAYQYAEGNPSLHPSINHNLEIKYILNKKYIFGLYYQNTINNFLQIPILDSITKNINFTRNNVGQKKTIGAYYVIPIMFTRWWELNNIISNYLYVENSSYLGKGIKYNSQVFSIQANNQIFFNKEKSIIGSINFQFNGPSRNYIYSISSTYYLDLGFKFSIQKNKMYVGFNASDIFYTANPKIITIENNINPIEFSNKNDNRSFRLSLIYKFGNINNRNEYKSNTEEINRTK